MRRWKSGSSFPPKTSAISLSGYFLFKIRNAPISRFAFFNGEIIPEVAIRKQFPESCSFSRIAPAFLRRGGMRTESGMVCTSAGNPWGKNFFVSSLAKLEWRMTVGCSKIQWQYGYSQTVFFWSGMRSGSGSTDSIPCSAARRSAGLAGILWRLCPI